MTALIRRVCGQTIGLPPLPAAADAASDDVVAAFAEQFCTDVSTITGQQRSKLCKCWATALPAGDAPRVEHGTEQYLLDVDGQTVFS